MHGLRIVFAGTPVFARVALDRLLGSRHPVLAVLTQPDRPAGRGQKPAMSPVKQAALAAGLPVLQPPSLRVRDAAALAADPSRRAASEAAAAALETLRALAPDVMIVAAYGLILPPDVLALPRLGCLNIHASLLPRWRGAAPIIRALEAGDAETGVGIMQMEAGLDTGPVALERRTAITASDTAATLHDRLAVLGAEAILEVLDRLAEVGTDGPVVFRPQPEAGACYARKVEKAEARIDWAAPAAAVSCRIRAFDPVPGAQTAWAPAAGAGGADAGEGEVIRVFDPVVLAGSDAGEPGRIVAVGPAGIEVACRSGRLRLRTVQRAGGRRLPAGDFLRGHPLAVGDRLR